MTTHTVSGWRARVSRTSSTPDMPPMRMSVSSTSAGSPSIPSRAVLPSGALRAAQPSVFSPSTTVRAMASSSSATITRNISDMDALLCLNREKSFLPAVCGAKLRSISQHDGSSTVNAEPPPGRGA